MTTYIITHLLCAATGFALGYFVIGPALVRWLKRYW